MDTRDVVVAFGASKGHAPGPVKAVRDALRKKGVEVHDVQEDYTSQLCNTCLCKVVPMYSQDGVKAIYGVRRCLTSHYFRV